MPDQSDVEDALAAWAAGVLYPDGDAADSLVGTVCQVFRGPVVAGTDDVALVSVTPADGTWRDVSRFGDEWQVLRHAPPGVTVRHEGGAAVFGGAPRPGDAAGVLAGGRAYAVRVRPGDDGARVAAALAALVRADRPAAVLGGRLSVPGVDVLGRVASDAAGGRELARVQMAFRLAVHAPGFALRDAVAAALERAGCAVRFLDVQGWACRVLPGGGATSDEGGTWRRDVLLQVEWPVTEGADLTAMLFGVAGLNGVGRLG